MNPVVSLALRILLLMLLISVPVARGEDWNRFRGPNGSSVDSLSQRLPVEFGPSKNLVWKTQVPFGQSSPIVVGDRVFLTGREGERLITFALDAKTGAVAWKREIQRERAHETYRLNDPASPSPAADEENLYVFFPDVGLVCYSRNGEERWRHPLGPFRNFYGMAASPVAVGDLVVLNCDQQSGSFLLAVEKATGRVRWRVERPGILMGWAVPIVYAPPKGGKELIVVCSNRVDSYLLATGERRWWFPFASDGAMGSPVLFGTTLLLHAHGHDQPMLEPFASVLPKYDRDKDGRLTREEFRGEQDWAEHFGWIDDDSNGFIDAKEWNAARELGVGDHGVLAIQMTGQGQLPPSAIRWRLKRNVPYLSAPVLYSGVLFMVRSGGVITSVDPSSGEILKQGRTPEAIGSYFAQPVAGDGKIYLISEAGKVTVLKADRQWEILAVNDLGEETYATPALSGGKIYVRTRTDISCFALQK